MQRQWEGLVVDVCITWISCGSQDPQGAVLAPCWLCQCLTGLWSPQVNVAVVLPEGSAAGSSLGPIRCCEVQIIRAADHM